MPKPIQIYKTLFRTEELIAADVQFRVKLFGQLIFRESIFSKNHDYSFRKILPPYCTFLFIHGFYPLINDNLYAQARAIVKQWVVENEGSYELLPLSEVAEINPDAYSPKEGWEYVNYLDTSSITDGCIGEIQRINPSVDKLPSRARRKVVPNDVVFSTVRPNQRHFGLISRPLPNMLASTGFAVIRSRNPAVCNELIYLCLTENAFIEKMQQLAEQSTSTFPSIKPSDLGTCEIPCPKKIDSSDLTETLKAMFTLIATNQHENHVLAELRDTLLPQLMSGEIDVSSIDY